MHLDSIVQLPVVQSSVDRHSTQVPPAGLLFAIDVLSRRVLRDPELRAWRTRVRRPPRRVQWRSELPVHLRFNDLFLYRRCTGGAVRLRIVTRDTPRPSCFRHEVAVKPQGTITRPVFTGEGWSGSHALIGGQTYVGGGGLPPKTKSCVPFHSTPGC